MAVVLESAVCKPGMYHVYNLNWLFRRTIDRKETGWERNKRFLNKHTRLYDSYMYCFLEELSVGKDVRQLGSLW